MADHARYFHFCSQEHFPPPDLLDQAVAAERAGFDGIATSDHLQPWWEPGESGHAWVWLGAAGQATERVPLGTGVTPAGPRHHPVLIAQAWATLETLFPGRPFLGFGSGESLNESPLGADWPPVGKQIERIRKWNPHIGEIHLPGHAIKFSRASGKTGSVATPGQHSEEVLRDLLHYDAARISALRAKRVI